MKVPQHVDDRGVGCPGSGKDFTTAGYCPEYRGTPEGVSVDTGDREFALLRGKRRDESCGAQAAWVVMYGNRRTDAQKSCSRHLSLTCEAMAQGTRHPLTVTAIEP